MRPLPGSVSLVVLALGLLSAGCSRAPVTEDYRILANQALQSMGEWDQLNERLKEGCLNNPEKLKQGCQPALSSDYYSLPPRANRHFDYTVKVKKSSGDERVQEHLADYMKALDEEWKAIQAAEPKPLVLVNAAEADRLREQKAKARKAVEEGLAP